MDRNALLIYLRDLRDLEVARYRINELIKQKSWQASKTREAVACMKHYTTMKAHLEAWEKNQKERGIPASDSILAMRQKQNETLRQLAQSYHSVINRFTDPLKKELAMADMVLKKAYSHNIIPGPYRNLASICYIYDYMSTSQSSLEDTLLHAHMEGGIQRITARLDAFMRQNEELILTARRIEYNTEQQLAQNKQILQTLQQNLAAQQRTAQNTQELSQYAKIAATSAQTCAFFQMATYFQLGGRAGRIV